MVFIKSSPKRILTRHLKVFFLIGLLALTTYQTYKLVIKPTIQSIKKVTTTTTTTKSNKKVNVFDDGIVEQDQNQHDKMIKSLLNDIKLAIKDQNLEGSNTSSASGCGKEISTTDETVIEPIDSSGDIDIDDKFDDELGLLEEDKKKLDDLFKRINKYYFDRKYEMNE